MQRSGFGLPSFRRCWLCGAIAGLVYASTHAPGVTSEDSGELVAAAVTRGVAHPPGFPLWTALAGAIVDVCGSPAANAALFSALFGALAVTGVALISIEVGLDQYGATSAALLVAFGGTFWSQSVVAEVYTLNAFLTAVQWFCVLRFAHGERWRWLAAGALAWGLGCTNHYMLTLLLTPPLAFYLVWTIWGCTRRPTGRQLLAIGGLGVVPLSLYVYLPWAASAQPLMNWGDPSTWGRFWAHVSRESYRQLELGTVPRPIDRLLFLWQMAGLGLQEFTAFVAVPGLFGLAIRRTGTKLGHLAFLWGIILFNGPVLMMVLRFSFDRDNRTRVNEYYLPAWMALALLLTLGWGKLLPPRRRVALLLLPLFPFLANYRQNDLRNMDVVHLLNVQLLECIPPNGILFPSSDFTSFPTVYLQTQGIRPDVLLGDITGTPSVGLRKHLRELKRPLLPKVPIEQAVEWTASESFRPVYITDRSQAPATQLLPWGRAYRVLRGAGASPARPPKLPPVRDTVRPALTRCPRGDCLDLLSRNLLATMLVIEAEQLDKIDETGVTERLRWAGELCRDDAKCLNTVGSTAARLGHLGLARQTLTMSVLADPGYGTSRRNAVTVCTETGSLSEGLRLLRTFLPLRLLNGAQRRHSGYSNQENVATEVELNNLGVTAARAGQFHEALWFFERALEGNPSYLAAWKNLEVLYRDHGTEPDAAELVHRLAGSFTDV